MFDDFNLWSFLSGLVSGGLGGALLTLKYKNSSKKASGSGSIADQSNAKAGGDIVGRDKKS